MIKKQKDEDQFIVFYTSVEKGIWNTVDGKKMPPSWKDGGFESVVKGVLNDKYDTEAWFYGSKNNAKKMRHYLKWLYRNYQNKGYLKYFTIRKHYPKRDSQYPTKKNNKQIKANQYS